jgi:hypothetical protein
MNRPERHRAPRLPVARHEGDERFGTAVRAVTPLTANTLERAAALPSAVANGSSGSSSSSGAFARPAVLPTTRAAPGVTARQRPAPTSAAELADTEALAAAPDGFFDRQAADTHGAASTSATSARRASGRVRNDIGTELLACPTPRNSSRW